MTTDTPCADCGAHITREPGSIGTGYARDPDTDARICYACCGKRDRAAMIETGRAVLYLTKSREGEAFPYVVTNWPGTLRFPVYSVRKGRHNVAGSRTDAWFTCEGQWWHAVQYGENSEIARCRRTKARATN
jgi:hypothetical protein